ncbi:MAG: hypothetical protein EBR86_16555, partial [Planctomycetia bacterium]|nr:hypothetical protein [Planctomycetia bacterium]
MHWAYPERDFANNDGQADSPLFRVVPGPQSGRASFDPAALGVRFSASWPLTGPNALTGFTTLAGPRIYLPTGHVIAVDAESPVLESLARVSFDRWRPTAVRVSILEGDEAIATDVLDHRAIYELANVTAGLWQSVDGVVHAYVAVADGYAFGAGGLLLTTPIGTEADIDAGIGVGWLSVPGQELLSPESIHLDLLRDPIPAVPLATPVAARNTGAMGWPGHPWELAAMERHASLVSATIAGQDAEPGFVRHGLAWANGSPHSHRAFVRMVPSNAGTTNDDNVRLSALRLVGTPAYASPVDVTVPIRTGPGAWNQYLLNGLASAAVSRMHVYTGPNIANPAASVAEEARLRVSWRVLAASNSPTTA